MDGRTHGRTPVRVPSFKLTFSSGELIILGNREVNYPNILPQEQQPKHFAMHVSKRTLKSTTTPQGTKIIHEKWIQAFSVHLINIFEMSNRLWYRGAKFENVIIG